MTKLAEERRPLSHRIRDGWELAKFAYQTFIAPWPPFTVFLLVSAAVNVATPIVIVYATAGLIDAVTASIGTGSVGSETFLGTGSGFLGWIALLLVARFLSDLGRSATLQRFVLRSVNLRSMDRLERMVYEKALSLRLEWFEYPTYYDSLQRAKAPLVPMEQLEGLTAFQTVLLTAASSLGVLVALGSVHFAIPVLLLAGSSFVIVANIRQAARFVDVVSQQAAGRRRQEYWSRLLTHRDPAAEVRLFGLVDYVLKAWHDLSHSLISERTAARIRNVRGGIFPVVANAVLLSLVLLSLVLAADQGLVTAGAIVGLLFVTNGYLERLGYLAYWVRALSEYLSKLKFLPTFLALEPEVRTSGVEPPVVLRTGVSFDAVGFTYPGSTKPALSDIDLEIRKGERIALVGENGAGKTTLTKLLLGLYEPTSGRITVDGIDLNEIAPNSWRDRVGAVFQDYMKYAFTARENIGLGQLDKIEDVRAVKRAAQATRIDQAIEALPDGYDTMLSREFPSGRDLSQGQWQSLAIARLYLRDAELLVMDEPASALDALAELEVYRQFLELSEDKTVVLVSHRLGSARLADRVVLLHEGRMAEQGTHDELVEAGGRYAELFEMQAEWYR